MRIKRHPHLPDTALLERAAVQERAAEMAIELAREAESTGQAESAQILWMLVLRCRTRALKLYARAGAEATQSFA